MKGWLKLLAIPAVIIAAGGLIYALRPFEPVPSSRPRNVILISIDTLRADHLSAYGYHRPTTPNLDAFARRGARFERAFSSSGWTVPAHMTMLTGVDPPIHGAHGYPKPRRSDRGIPTLAEILRRRGFETAAFTGGGYIAATFGFNRGFQKFISKGRHFTHSVDLVRRWVRARRDQPFFLFFHGYDVHRPYKPLARYARLFSDGYTGNFRVAALRSDQPRPSEADLRFTISQYDAEIRAVDDLLGELLADLESLGVLDETLVVITSDHGEEFYEHGQIYHAHSLYDELLHVPLIVVGPGVVPAVHKRQVGLIDLAPTILGMLGLSQAQKGMQGVDLTPVLAGHGEPPERVLFSFLRYSSVAFSLAAARTDDWKLIAWNLEGMRTFRLRKKAKEYLHKMRLDRRENFVELFDLRNDPGETRDVGADHPEGRDRLKAILDEHSSEHGANDDGGDTPVLREKDIRALKALGYL
jgi:arylsulfatase A-like enzyme